MEASETLEAAIHEQVEALRDKEAIFCLRALMLAGHVSLSAMKAVIDLSHTVKND